jgi:flavin reductase (DIM6/NTAB) family NADH-FMN oxidoreductase RutF
MAKSATLHPLDQAPQVSDQRHVRDCLGMFATGVTVVTTRNDSGERIGLTASSFNTLSLGPPLVLWSLGLNSSSLAVFRAAKHFAVNVLESHQLDVARRFSRRVADRFADVAVHEGSHAMPLLTDALAWFECETRAMHEFGDHVLFIGEVIRCAKVEGSPLLFRKGEFAISQTFDDDAWAASVQQRIANRAPGSK